MKRAERSAGKRNVRDRLGPKADTRRIDDSTKALHKRGRERNGWNRSRDYQKGKSKHDAKSNKEIRLQNQEREEEDEEDEDVEIVAELNAAEASDAVAPQEPEDEVSDMPRDEDGFLAPPQGARRKTRPPAADKKDSDEEE